MKSHNRFYGKLIVGALVLISLTATFFAWRSSSLDAESSANERFQNRVIQIQSAIQDRMLAYEHVLRGGAGMFAASGMVSRQAWHDYVESLHLDEYYPGIQGMGFSKLVLPSEAATHIARIRHEGFPDYAIRPPGKRAEYTSIIYLEPFDERNKRAFGFDMFSEATRHAAMELARDSGKASISAKVKLVQETKENVQTGFLMYLPVYRGAPAENTAQRRAALVGYVYSPFRMNDLMQGVLGKTLPDVALGIYDGMDSADGSEMYQSNGANPGSKPAFFDSREISINGHEWTLNFASLPAFEAEIDTQTPRIIAVSGLVLTAMFSLLAWSLLGTRTRALELANAMTISVREKEERFRSVVDTAIDGIIIISELGIVELCNAAAQRIFAYSAGEMIGQNVKMLMPEPYQGRHDGYLDHFLRTGEATVIGGVREVVGLRKDGTVFPPELTVGEMHIGKQRKFTGMMHDITERKQTENEWRVTMRLQHAILESASHAIISTAVDGTILLFNPAAERMLGYKAEELVGKVTPAVIHVAEEVVARAKTISAELGRNIEPGFEVFAAKSRLGYMDENEWTYVRKDGSHVPVLLSVTAQRDENNGITGFLGIASDISERKAFETAVRESEERYRLMAEYSSDMISRFSADGVLNYISPASATLLGYEPPSMLGKSLFDWIHPDDMAMAVQKLKKVLDNHVLDTLTCRVRTVEGNYIWLETSLRGLRENAPTSKQQIVGVSRDVTERVQTTSNLNRFKHILDNTLDMLFMFEPDSLQFIYLNKGATESMGYSAEEMLEMTPFQIKPLIPETKFRELIAPLFSGEKQSLNLETLHRRKNGSEFPVEIFVQLVREVDGKGIFVAIVRDITERRKIDRLKNEFVSTVSHELRTPLTSIRGSLGLVAGGVAGEISAQAKGLIDIAYKNSERLVRLINDILDIEKIESGKMILDLKLHDLMSLVEHSIEDNHAYGKAFGVKFKITAAMQGVQVMVDEDRLMQVMANLLSNAAKFSPANSDVEIAVCPGEFGVRITVTDKGSGIAEEFHSRIFQKFSQADSSDTRQKGGTGLGLSISKAIVEKMDGVIGFLTGKATEAGVGSAFYFELPASNEAGIEQKHISSGHKSAQSDMFRVLVCEDDEDVALLLSLMLSGGGFITDVALNARQAKALLQSNRYDAMTLDIGLPDQDGISLIRELRAQDATANLPIVVVSAQVEKGRTEINGGYALVGWHEKPIDREHLLAQLNAIVSKNCKKNIPHILHVEDDPDIRHILSSIGHGIAVFDHAGTLKEAAIKLSLAPYDLVVLDMELPDGSGLQVIPLMQGLNHQTPVMIFSGKNVTRQEAEQVSSVLIKSCTSNQELLDTITKLVTGKLDV